MKQKITAFLLVFIAFGLLSAFVASFDSFKLSFAFAGVFVAFCVYRLLAKKNSSVLDFVFALQPVAAILFLFAFILSFLSVSMVLPFFIATIISCLICIQKVFLLKKEFESSKTFLILFLIASVLGGVTAWFFFPRLFFMAFFLLSLGCPVESYKKSIQESWLDIALPLFVCISSFVVFVASNHIENFPAVVFQSVAMVLIGSMPIICKKSSLRLALMTVVLMVFGSYVFSIENPSSAFHSKQISVSSDVF